MEKERKIKVEETVIDVVCDNCGKSMGTKKIGFGCSEESSAKIHLFGYAQIEIPHNKNICKECGRKAFREIEKHILSGHSFFETIKP